MSEDIRLIAVGDIMLGDHPVRFGHGVRSMTQALGAKQLFSNAQEILADGEIIFGNIESVLSDIGLIAGKLQSEEFRGSPSIIPILHETGFNVVSFSNNHCMEHGLDAFWDTVRHMREHNIFPAGIRGNDGHCLPYETNIRGTKVMILSISLRPENYHVGSVPYAHQEDFSKVLNEVKRYRGQSDVLIVSLHWGHEYMDYPSPKQILLAHRLVDEAGVNLILGHHPHVLQAVEQYRDSVIAYSLGNFASDIWQRQTRESMVLKAMLSKNGISSFNLVPIHINDAFQPEPLSSQMTQHFVIRMHELENLLKGKFLTQDLNDENLIERLESDYIGLARRKELLHRLSSYSYFIRNIHKFQFSIISQSLMRSLSRRFEPLRGRN